MIWLPKLMGLIIVYIHIWSNPWPQLSHHDHIPLSLPILFSVMNLWSSLALLCEFGKGVDNHNLDTNLTGHTISLIYIIHIKWTYYICSCLTLSQLWAWNKTWVPVGMCQPTQVCQISWLQDGLDRSVETWKTPSLFLLLIKKCVVFLGL